MCDRTIKLNQLSLLVLIFFYQANEISASYNNGEATRCLSRHGRKHLVCQLTCQNGECRQQGVLGVVDRQLAHSSAEVEHTVHVVVQAYNTSSQHQAIVFLGRSRKIGIRNN